MNLTVRRSANLRGQVAIPPNKSHSFRALIMAGLADGVSHILHPAMSDDWMRGTEALEMFGATIEPRGRRRLGSSTGPPAGPGRPTT